MKRQATLIVATHAHLYLSLFVLFQCAVVHVARSSVTEHPLRQVCRESGFNMIDYLDPEDVSKIHGPDRADYVWEKPATVHNNSLCASMKQSCCTTKLEEILEKQSYNDYKALCSEAVMDYLSESSCLQMLKTFNRKVYDIFYSARTELEDTMKQTVVNTSSHTFRDLFNFLYKFPYKLDLSDIKNIVESQMDKLSEVVYLSLGGSNDSLTSPEIRECLTNTSRTIYKPFRLETTHSMHRVLNNLKLYISSLELATKVQDRILSHRFSKDCRYSLPSMDYCMLCVGLIKIRPCLNFCINKMRGCYVDLSELSKSYENLMNSLKILANEVNSEMNSQALAAQTLHGFVAATKELQNSLLTEMAAQQCIVADSTHERNDQPEKRNTLHSLFTTAKLKFSQQFIMDSFTCLERTGTMLKGIPEFVCSLMDNPVSSNGNSYCWNGTTIGSYDYPLVGLTREEQTLTNAFIHTEQADADKGYNKKLERNLIRMSMRINSTLWCLQSDDEDCNKPTDPTQVIEGSGEDDNTDADKTEKNDPFYWENHNATTVDDNTVKPQVTEAEVTTPKPASIELNSTQEDSATTSTGGSEQVASTGAFGGESGAISGLGAAHASILTPIIVSLVYSLV